MAILMNQYPFMQRLIRASISPALHHRYFTTSCCRNMKVVPVPVRSDNYAYLCIDEGTNVAAAIDPFDVPKVIKAAEDHGVKLVQGITTHHHMDHSGGNEKFASQYPDAPIIGGSNQIPALTKQVKDGDTFKIGENISVKCMATPCHTQDSICYYATDDSKPNQPGVVWTGDTLFIGGCGRFFEGTPEEMVSSLKYLATLPDKTIVYNGHEYTKGNVAYAKSVDPDNEDIKRLDKLTADNKITTGLTTIGDEKKWNVFMPVNFASAAVRKATGASTDSEIMGALREQKNNFRG